MYGCMRFRFTNPHCRTLSNCSFGGKEMSNPNGASRPRLLLFLLFLVFSTAGLAAGAAPVLIGLDTNPPPSEHYSPATLRKWFKIGVDAGMDQVSISPIWKYVEKTPGHYNLSDEEHQSQLASDFNLPIYLNIRIIDTNNNGVPAAYAKWSFADPRLAQKLEDLIHALASHLHGDIRWVSVGNEVDDYFKSHQDQIAAYRTLLDRIRPTLKEAFPKAQFTVNFTFGGLAGLHKEFKPITDAVDFYSFTYYPMHGDFTFRNPGVANGDIHKMVEAAGNHKVFFQEIGYSSSKVVASSQAQQAQFLKNVFAALREYRSHIIAAHFVWMSDIALSLVNHFGEYYKLPNSDKFKAFLASLGYFQRDGKPKAAWKVFEQEAPKMAHP